MCWVCIIDSVYLHYGAKQLYQCVLIWYEPWSMPVCKYLVAMQPRMMQTSFNVNFNLPLYLLDWVISERPESDFTKVAAYTTSPHNLCKCLHSRSDYVWYLVKRCIYSIFRHLFKQQVQYIICFTLECIINVEPVEFFWSYCEFPYPWPSNHKLCLLSSSCLVYPVQQIFPFFSHPWIGIIPKKSSIRHG